MFCPSCSAATNPGDRFCANCGAGLEQRCVTCGTLLPADARFCSSCGTATSATESAATVEHAGEERKVVSVLFADLVGFTASSDGADPEDVRRRVQPFHTALREVVEGFGGRIEKLMGDGVLAVFGAPIAHEDDAERAVRAGLQIQERVEVLGHENGMRARVAVGTGEAMVLVDGTTTDREGLIGDVVNTASRLQGEAEPGTVLVDEATHRATRRAFLFEERPPVAVKGKSEPLAIWVATEPVARLGSDVEDDGASLVGRSSELALLIDSFSRAVEDRTSQIVTIAGEPGVGKSRLVRELRRHINDLPDLIRWRQGRCLPYGEGITYWSLGEIVKAEAGILETDSPATAVGKLGVSLEALLADSDERAWVGGRLAPLVGSEQEVSIDKGELFAAWHRYLAAMGEQRPTVIFIEDLHWADASMVEFLDDVPDATRGTPLMLVCTARPDYFETHPNWGAGQRNAVTVRLEPLNAVDTSHLLDALMAGTDLEPELRQTVLERSGGNPLWAQEFVRMLRDRTSASGDLAIPDTVQAVVASRIDLLDTETKTVIQAAATVGKSFWNGAVKALLGGVEPLDDNLRELARRELIRRERISTVAGETEYAFTHALVRDVAYGQSPRPVRAERHYATARWIEGIAGDRVGDRAEVIAHHDSEALRIASTTDESDVTRFADAAFASHVRAAEQVAQLDAAAWRAHLEAALELALDGDPRRAPVLLDLGRALGNVGVLDQGIKTTLEARSAFEQGGDLERWGEATALLAQYYWINGDPAESERMLVDGVARLEPLTPGPTLAGLYSQQAGRLWLRGDSIEEALAHVERVRPIVEVHGDLTARRRLLSAEGGSRFDAGDPSAVEVFRQVLRMSIEADDSQPIGSAYLNLGEQLRTGWSIDEAISVHERGLEVALQRRTRGVEQFLRQSLADDFFLAGRFDRALEHIESGLALPDVLPYMRVGFEASKLRIETCRNQGGAGAIEKMDQILADSMEMEDLQVIVPALESSAWIQWLLGSEATALSHARGVLERAGATRFLFDAFAMPLWLLRRAGELDRYVDLLPDLRRFDMPRPRAQIAMIESLLAEGTDPEGALDGIVSATDQLVGLGLLVEATFALAEATRIARALGDSGRAGGHAVRARELLEPAGADLLAERLGI